MRRAIGGGFVALVVGTGALSAQDPVRVGLLGSPRAGRPAPELVLPFQSAAGPGPADQPFRLSAELGRVVVLVFGGRPDSTRVAAWREVSLKADSATGPLVVAGVVTGGEAEAGALAERLGGRLKVLVDADGRAHRAYGVATGSTGWAVWVVGDDGVVVWGGRLDPRSRTWWREVEGAIRRGRTAGAR